jgi:hypothetical protein
VGCARRRAESIIRQDVSGYARAGALGLGCNPSRRDCVFERERETARVDLTDSLVQLEVGERSSLDERCEDEPDVAVEVVVGHLWLL